MRIKSGIQDTVGNQLPANPFTHHHMAVHSSRPLHRFTSFSDRRGAFASGVSPGGPNTEGPGWKQLVHRITRQRNRELSGHNIGCPLIAVHPSMSPSRDQQSIYECMSGLVYYAEMLSVGRIVTLLMSSLFPNRRGQGNRLYKMVSNACLFGFLPPDHSAGA